jgi:hypothetical protein
MKGARIGFILISCLAGIIALLTIMFRPDPAEVIFRRLEGRVPPGGIVFAKQAGYGREPTFIGLIQSNGVTNWPTLFETLGCSPAADRLKEVRVQDLVRHFFGEHVVPADSNLTTGFEVWAGTLEKGPYYVSALVSQTNAFVVLQRY